jgi:hypothetical protein
MMISKKKLIAYNDISNYLDNDDQEIGWKFKKIVAHQGPLTSKDKDWKGSMWNVMIEWENGEVIAESLSTVAADNPITCALYAKENKLLGIDG